HSAATIPHTEDISTHDGSTQQLFFPSSQANTLIFANWEQTSLAEFMDILELSKPKIIFDFRVTPRFDLETLSRKRFFAQLQQYGCLYVDLYGRLGITNVRAADGNPALIAAKV